MRTVAYVDGFNFYYGCLKGTPYKWLDLCAYFDLALPAACELVAVKYFTARVAPVPTNPDAATKQQAYLMALAAHCKHRLHIIEGHFNVKKARAPLAEPPHKTVEIIKTEEKGSDVNLAVDLVNDAWHDMYDCAVVVSNDGDLERAMSVVKRERKKTVYLYTPGGPKRRALNTLKRWANKQFDVNPEHLKASQLPESVGPGSLRRPEDW